MATTRKSRPAIRPRGGSVGIGALTRVHRRAGGSPPPPSYPAGTFYVDGQPFLVDGQPFTIV